jgi:protein TonB
MRNLRTATGGLLCLATLGCGSTGKYIPLNSIGKTSPPSKIEVLSDFPDSEYMELGVMRLRVPSSQPNIEPTNGQLESLKREAGRHGADAVVVLPCRTDRFARTEKGRKIPYVYFLDVFAIAWPDQVQDTASDLRIDEEQTAGHLPDSGDFVKVEEFPVELYRGGINYPPRSGLSGTSGTVWIQELIDKKGRPREVRVLRSSGVDAGFEEAAKEAAERNRFRPAKQRGKPVAVWISYKVDFKIRY